MKLGVDHVYKSFRQGERSIHILRGVSFEAEPGGTVSIVGQSGSGKSTLLALLAGLDRPDQGSIRMGEKETSSWNEDEWARFRSTEVGIIFQQFHLMSDLTALENISLPLELSGTKDAVSRAQELLVSVGLEDRGHHFIRQLSGGECQRVAIARALVTRPRILLADEPTGNLDQDTAAPVADLMFSLAEKTGTILVLVTHNDQLASRCQRVFHLRQGVLQ